MALRFPGVLLVWATGRLHAGDVVCVGCYCREALRRHLRALCDEHGWRPDGRDQQPRALAKALQAVGVLSDEERAEVKQLANTCHKAAHLLCVTRGRTLTTIEATRSVVSGAMVC